MESVQQVSVCLQCINLFMYVLLVVQAPPTPRKQQQETPMETDNNFQKRRMSFTVSPG